MRPYGLALVLFALVQVQLAVMPATALEGTMPSLPLLVTLSASLLLAPELALWWALFMGWLLDWRSGSAGAYSLPLIAVAVLAAVGRRRFFGGGLALSAAFTVLGSLLHLGLQLLLAARWSEAAGWDGATLAGLATRYVIVNLLWLPVILWPMRHLAARLSPPSMGWER